VNPATKAFLSGGTNPVLSKPFDFREPEQLVVSIINRGISGQESDGGRTESALTSSSY